MYQIDKEKFGAFVAQLRKEQGLMQKDLAARLYVSDKAVSKWERGLSIPDVSLLVPLAELLGVSVTELLECRRLPKAEPMDTQQTEELEKKVIDLTGEEQRKYRPDRWKRGAQLLVCAIAGGLEVWLLTQLGFRVEEMSSSILLMMGMMLGFGLYFCVFARERLPQYYDDNKVSAFSDGFLRMNMPGVYFNNRNWPHIVRAGQLWAMIGLIGSPVFYYVMRTFLPRVWEVGSVYIILALVLGGLFIPMTAAARKYEYAPEHPRPGHVNRRDWIWIGSTIAFTAVLALLLAFVLPGTRGSGFRVAWTESSSFDHWSASYGMHDGWRERTVQAEGVIHVEVVDGSGRIGLTVTGEDGTVLFEDADLNTSSFDIPAEGRVTIRITGENHQGSFLITW